MVTTKDKKEIGDLSIRTDINYDHFCNWEKLQGFVLKQCQYVFNSS